MSERDTHFAGFASLLWQEIRDRQRQQIEGMDDGLVHTSAEWSAECEKIIAQRTYDLAYHFIEDAYELLGTFIREIHQSVEMLNDLGKWPDVGES